MHTENYPISLMKSHVKCDWIIFCMHMFMKVVWIYSNNRAIGQKSYCKELRIIKGTENRE